MHEETTAMKKTTMLTTICFLTIMSFSNPVWSLTISGKIFELGSDDKPIIGAVLEAWNVGGWMDDTSTSGMDGEFLLGNIASGPGYQIFVGKDASYVDVCSHFVVLNENLNDMLIDLIPLSLWNEKLGEYDTSSGYILGEIFEGGVDDSMVEGASVQLYDLGETPLPESSFVIIYFDKDYNLVPELTATSESGMFMVIVNSDALDESNDDPVLQYPHPKYKDIKLTAQKEDWSFPTLNVSPVARVFPFDDTTRVGAGIVTAAAVGGTQNPIIPDTPQGEDSDNDTGGGDDGGGGGCFLAMMPAGVHSP